MMPEQKLARILAPLLASYEMDEPHTFPGPHDYDQDSNHYPEFTWGEIAEWLAVEHEGDCVNQPQPCRRCAAEDWWHKAQWIAGKLGPDLDTNSAT